MRHIKRFLKKKSAITSLFISLYFLSSTGCGGSNLTTCQTLYPDTQSTDYKLCVKINGTGSFPTPPS